MERQIVEGRHETGRLRGRVATHAKLVEQYEKTIERAGEIRMQAAQLRQARSDLARMDAALARRMALDTETERLEGEINARGARLTAETQALRSRLDRELRPGRSGSPDRAGRWPVWERDGRPWLFSTQIWPKPVPGPTRRRP